MNTVTPPARPAYRHGQPTIGVVAGWQFYWITTPLNYLNPLFRGLVTAAQAHGCNLLLACGLGPATAAAPFRPAWPDPAPDADFVPVGPWNTEALIVINPLLTEARSRYIQSLRTAGQPMLFVGDGEPGPTLMADNESGIAQAMGHLVEHGHQRIAFIAGNPADLEGDTGDRLRAYQAAVQTHGLATDAHLVAYGRNSFEGGRAAMRRILESGVAFTAVLAHNDESAMGAMRALQETGRRIPADTAIIGFDDQPEDVTLTPPLASVHVPLFELGYQALELMLARLAGQAAPAERLKVPTRLVPRPSCGCQPEDLTPAEPLSLTVDTLPLAHRMTTAILAETQSLNSAEVQAACQNLVQTLQASRQQNSPRPFQQAVENILERTETAGEEAYLWNTALAILRNAAPGLWGEAAPPALDQCTQRWLDQAERAVSESALRQYRKNSLDQRLMLDRVGLLTARLLLARDEAQIFEVLSQNLPEMGIPQASLAFLEADGADPVAWSTLRHIATPAAPPLRFATRLYPPEPGPQPFIQVVLPLASQQGRLGFMAFEAAKMEIYGAIVQEITAALNSAQLYRAATEGRRLAEEANQLKSHFLSMVSHELRTPLNLIVGLSEIVLREGDHHSPPLPESIQKDMERIHSSARHLGWLIRDVLDLASSEAGQLRLTNEYLDLSQILQTVAEAGRQMAQAKGLEWQEAWPESGPRVWGDRTRLRQIVLNLVNNAVKFTAHGAVCLRVETQARTAMVTVTDTGLGIPPEEQALVFNEFHRSEQAQARGYGGLGLGLAICKRLVELHGGQIGVRSTGQAGAGATFYFTLPLIDAAVRLPEELARERNAQQRVLLMTTRAGDSGPLPAQLRQPGVDVQTLCLDQTADWPAQLLQQAPDIVVLDISLAPTQSWEVLAVVKGNPATHHIPVLFYTLSPEGGSALELDYLTKPVSTTDLAQALAQQGLEETETEKIILVVDDDPGTLAMHRRIVQTQSPAYRVVEARNGREALEVLDREHPALVLLDLLMPELDGFGVLEAMRAKEDQRHIPVIVLTGQALTGADMDRLNRGVATVLSKGMFSVAETLAYIEAALARKRRLGSEAQRLVRKAMAYLHEHYATPLTREDLTRHIGLSDDYLTDCFRKEMGLTPIAYLNRYRITQAKTLLKNSAQTITAIALAVGFSDSGYFSRVFRRETGLSPDAYRRTLLS